MMENERCFCENRQASGISVLTFCKFVYDTWCPLVDIVNFVLILLFFQLQQITSMHDVCVAPARRDMGGAAPDQASSFWATTGPADRLTHRAPGQPT